MAANKNDSLGVFILSEAYAADLKGRQSVRTTFKLSQRCIDALSLLAGQLGIKQKSLFDHLVEDIQVLKSIARDVESKAAPGGNRVAKTYVISRRTLDNLEQVASRYQAPRDALVESSIQRIMPLLREEKKKHENRKMLLEKCEGFMQQGHDLLDQADSLLERDDPVFEIILQMVRAVKSGGEEINEIVEKGRRLEEY